MNYSDSERLVTLLEAYGFEKSDSETDADLVVFNSCSVRQKAENRVHGAIANLKKARKKDGNLLIALTGCMVKAGKEEKIEKRIKHLDIAFRPEDMGDLGDRIKEMRPDWKMVEDEGSLGKYFEIHPQVANKYQVFVPIMTGCDKFCTYCIVPYSRGREKSRDWDEIISECTHLVENGAKEITLLGQTVDSYGLSNLDKKSGKFEGKTFPKLLRELDKLSEKGLTRLRFTSPHPKDFSQELIDTIAELETLCPYIHLPVQSGSNSCLRRMNRPYTREKYIDIIERIRKAIPECAISTDIIVGFCGETEEEFQDSCDLYNQLGFDMAYIAKYSTRKGTFADKKLDDDVPYEVKTERWCKLNEILKKNSLKTSKVFEDKTVEVLIEQQGDELMGRSREFKDVRITDFDKSKDWIGEVVNVKINKARTWLLQGEIINL